MSLIYSPGPAAYDLGSAIGKAPAVSMKSRPKPSDGNRVPGPGSYQLQATIGGGPQFTMRPKTSQAEEAHNVPGPGQARGGRRGQREQEKQDQTCAFESCLLRARRCVAPSMGASDSSWTSHSLLS